MKDKLKITITTNYCTDDDDFSGDYHEIDMVVFNETLGVEFWKGGWGDEYHDKGSDKCDAVLEFIQETMSEEFDIEVVTLDTNTFNC